MASQRALGSYTVQFGLVAIPVSLYTVASANESKTTRNQLHKGCGNRLNLGPMVCQIHGQVAKEDITKAHEYAKGKYVEISDDELKALATATAESIGITSFCPESELDSAYFEKGYYLEPGKGGGRPFALLARALEAEHKVALANICVRGGKEQLCALRVSRGKLFLHTLFYEDELKVELDGTLPEVSDKELEMAKMLMGALAKPFDAEQYTDRFKEAFDKLVETKIADPSYIAPLVEGKPQEATVDLAAALMASLKQAQAA